LPHAALVHDKHLLVIEEEEEERDLIKDEMTEVQPTGPFQVFGLAALHCPMLELLEAHAQPPSLNHGRVNFAAKPLSN
jgi:hypothetical protein